ncbi:MAG: PH domain-containing protein [Actinomycetota bacterium]|nr:PH domain-containing protein [Rubrobacteraceae bacterium]MBA3703943.1 PH domain-containing protein [Rubrobacteraceae bacterium]MDQ3183979.1 PH domain-containing protein [Actinomycetota bacterium]
MNSEKHLHPVGMLVGAIRTLRRWISGLVLPGVFLLVSQGFSLWTVTLFLLGILAVAVLAALWGFLSWRATTYAVTGNSFRLRQGVFQKSERTIPLEHVQSVDTVQGIIQRAFGVVEVRIETAGGGVSEPDASLSALDRDAVQTLRREIEGPQIERSEETTGPTVLRRLSTRELLVAGATSGQIGVAFSLIAVGSQFLDDFLSESFVRRLLETLAPNWLMVVLILVPAAVLLAWLLAIAGTVLAYTGFTLSREGDFLYIKRGLLERREATIPLARIQAVRISEGVLRQPFGLASLRVESAGYGEDAGVSTTLFPLLPSDEVGEFLAVAAPEFAVVPTLKPLPRRALRRYVIRATFVYLIIAFAAAPVSFLVLQSALGLLALFLILPAATYGWLCYRDAGWALEEDRLVVRYRSLGRKTAVAPRRRLQSRGVIRSPFQRRARLATFLAEVASGSGGSALRVRDLDAVAAETLAGELGPKVRLEGA